MAKSSGADAILDKLTAPEFMFLQEPEKLRFLQSAGTLNKHGMSAFRLGSKPMNLIQIAHFILAQKPTGENFDEPSFETQINNLVSVGLLAKDTDGAICCPILMNAKTRADASRINGLRGGRPKKAEAQEKTFRKNLAATGQRQITRDAGNENPSAKDTTYLLNKVTKEVEVSSVSEPEYHEIGRAALDAAGLDPARSMATYGVVRQWLADGADRQMILDVITTKTKPSVTTLNYFNAAIREAISAKPPEKQRWQREYDKAMAVWEMVGRGIDPIPNLADFKERFAA